MYQRSRSQNSPFHMIQAADVEMIRLISLQGLCSGALADLGTSTRSLDGINLPGEKLNSLKYAQFICLTFGWADQAGRDRRVYPCLHTWLQTSAGLKFSSSAVLTEAYSLYLLAMPARHIRTQTHTQSQTPADHHGRVGFTAPDALSELPSLGRSTHL